MNAHQRYLIEEFVEEYVEKRMSRRDLLRRVLLITGSVTVTASVLSAMGCGDDDDDAAEPERTAAAATATAAGATPPSATTTGVTVQPSDPAIDARDVRFPGPAAEMLGYLARPKASGAYAGVIIIHENQGLNEHTKDVARRYAKENFIALAPDLVSRAGGTKAEAAENSGALGRATPDDLVADLLASIAYLKSQQGVRGGGIAATGFCFGGGYTWELVVASPDVKAAAPYYGTVRRLDDLAKTKTAVLAIYGGNDARVTAQAPQVEERLKTAGAKYEIKVYDGASHAFFNDTRQSYNAEASRDAWQRTLAWFRQNLSA